MWAAAAGGEANLIRQLERKRGRALNLLSLSGGGQNGAFGAGLLAGWRESGQRPEFDIVGGVSTGALRPRLPTRCSARRPTMRCSKRCTRKSPRKTSLQKEGLSSLAFGADSLSDTAPLRELIAKFITAENLETRGCRV